MQQEFLSFTHFFSPNHGSWETPKAPSFLHKDYCRSVFTRFYRSTPKHLERSSVDPSWYSVYSLAINSNCLPTHQYSSKCIRKKKLIQKILVGLWGNVPQENKCPTREQFSQRTNMDSHQMPLLMDYMLHCSCTVKHAPKRVRRTLICILASSVPNLFSIHVQRRLDWMSSPEVILSET